MSPTLFLVGNALTHLQMPLPTIVLRVRLKLDEKRKKEEERKQEKEKEVWSPSCSHPCSLLDVVCFCRIIRLKCKVSSS